MNAIPYHIRIQLSIILLCIAEAWLEQVVIKMKNPASADYIMLNRQEHRRSALYYASLILTYLIIAWDQTNWYILFPLLVVHRRIFFEYALKIFRKRRVEIIDGDQFFDTISRSLFGKYGGHKELGILILLAAAGNWWLFSLT